MLFPTFKMRSFSDVLEPGSWQTVKSSNSIADRGFWPCDRPAVSQTVRVEAPKPKRNVGLQLRTDNSITNGACRSSKT